MKIVTLSLPDEIVREIDQAAESFLRSRSNLVNTVLTDWIKNRATGPLARDSLARTKRKDNK